MVFKKAINFYINSSLHVALAVVAFSVITCLNFRISIDLQLLLFIFFGTITGYNFIKYAAIARFQHRSLSFNLRRIQILSFVAFIGLITTFFYQSTEVLLTSAILGFFTLLYAFPFSREHRNLRRIPGLKIYIIAFVVAGVTVILPVLQESDFPASDHFIEFIQRIIIALVLILPFEIRDIDHDNFHLGTIPQKLGISRTRSLGYLLTIGFCSLELLKSEIYLIRTLGYVFLGILCILFLKKASADQGEYFASFWVEAAPMFWLGIFYLMSVIT